MVCIFKSTQLSLKLAEQFQNNKKIKTQDSLNDLSQSLCNIEHEMTSLGQLRPKVEAKKNELGTFKAIEEIKSNILISFMLRRFNIIVQRQVGLELWRKQHWLSDGKYLESKWTNTKTNGPARMIYSNGDVFEGMPYQNQYYCI